MTTARPSFSICIPNYNYGRYIGETIGSVLAQGWSDFEIVVVDNASTDDSVAVVEAIGSDRVHLFRNRYNVGFAPNLDRAAERASNDYVIMLSSDDLMRSAALATYAAAIERLGEGASNCLFVSAIDWIDSAGAVTGGSDRPDSYDLEPDSVLEISPAGQKIEVFDGAAVARAVMPRMGVPGPFCSTCYSRDLYERVGGYSSPHQIGPDAHFAYKCLIAGAKVAYVRAPLFAYRMHGGNQLAQDRSRLTVRLPLDRYLFTVAYSDDQLSRVGLSRKAMIPAFVDLTCVVEGFHELRQGSWYQAFRYLLFALACYPSAALASPRWWALAGLVGLGPLGPIAARAVHGARRSRSGRDAVRQSGER